MSSRLAALRYRAFRGTIWDPSLLEEVPRRFRGIYTVVLPTKYALYAGFGVAGTLTRVPAIVEFTSVGYADIWTFMVGLLGAIALLGLVLRAEWVELISITLLAVGLATYPIATLALAIAGDADRWAIAIGLWVFVVLIAWRVTDAVRTIRRRAEAEQRRRAWEAAHA